MLEVLLGPKVPRGRMGGGGGGKRERCTDKEMKKAKGNEVMGVMACWEE